ncbi:MAG: hypothetical protein MZW92_78980 [Comamonadaceae bacterium]|nr:hypothetical protein [Comamonadaceae bacterium]
MMRYGIPGFRTPREVLDAEIQRILDLGVRGAHEDPHRHRRHHGADPQPSSTPCSSAWAPRPAARCRCPAPRRPTCVTATAFLKAFNDGRMQPRRQARGGHRRRRHLDRRRHRRAPPRPHHSPTIRCDCPERVIAGHMAHDVAAHLRPPGRRGDADLGVHHRQDAGQQARDRAGAGTKASHIRGGLSPVGVVKGADGRATALRVAECEAKFVGGKLEIKINEGTEQRHPGRPDRLRHRPGRSISPASKSSTTASGLITADKNYQVAGQAGRVRRRRHPAPAPADHRHRPRRHRRRRHRPCASRGQELDKRPEGRRPLLRLAAQDDSRSRLTVTAKCTSRSAAPTGRKDAVHNFENRSDRYVIPHDELFLGHFAYTRAPQARGDHARAPRARWATSRSASMPLSEKQAIAEGQALHELRHVLRVRQLRGLLPADRGVPASRRRKSTIGRYVDTDYDKCIGCHICARRLPDRLHPDGPG